MAPSRGTAAELDTLVLPASWSGGGRMDDRHIADDDMEEDDFLEFQTRRQSRQRTRGQDHPLHHLHRYLSRSSSSRVAFYIIGIIVVLLIAAVSQYQHQPATVPAMGLDLADNPYFFTGDVWEHNAQVSARLDRCAELGLLRNTADILPPLEDKEEAAAMAEGCGTNQTTVIILSSVYMAEAFHGSSTAGETIYAQSVISTLNRWNYSYMFSSLGWFNDDMRKTMEIYRRHRGQVRMVLADPAQVDLCWHDVGQRCLKTDENEDGVPAWRLLSFWYWDDARHPLGPSFTLSPSPANDNHFLSYSIEPTCRRLPVVPREWRQPPQVYLLAKQIKYFEPRPEFSWTLQGLHDIQRELNIRMVGGIKEDVKELADAVREAGIVNLGVLGKIEFYEQLAKSFVLLGVGQPRISPIHQPHPDVGRDRSGEPDKMAHAAMEDDGARTVCLVLFSDKRKADGWPYVYHVHAHDLDGLGVAIQSALNTPIRSFIPDHMRFDFVCNKMAELLEMDWRAKAAAILDERIRTGQEEIFSL